MIPIDECGYAAIRSAAIDFCSRTARNPTDEALLALASFPSRGAPCPSCEPCNHLEYGCQLQI